MRRLKDTIVRECVVTLNRLVEHRKDGPMITNEPVAYLVKIACPGGRTTLFRCDTESELWKELQSCIHIWIDHPQTPESSHA